MTAHRQSRVVHEPGTLAPWIVQLSAPGGEPWIDWRRFHDEDDARRYIAVASDRLCGCGPRCPATGAYAKP